MVDKWNKISVQSQCDDNDRGDFSLIYPFPFSQCPSPPTFNLSFTALVTIIMIIFYTLYPEPPQDRARAKLARLERSLVVPEFADSTPLDLFDWDGVLVEAAPHWSWESARTTVIPRVRYAEYSDWIHIPSLEDVGGVICGSI